MSYKTGLIAVIVLLGLLFLALMFGSRGEDNSPDDSENENLRNVSVEAGDEIESPLTITGEARLWYFEASFPVELYDSNNNLLAQAPATAQGEWMTEDFVPFEVTLEFANEEEQNGTLVLRNSNPSGDPVRDESVSIPVRILPSTSSESQIVSIFLSNLDDQASDCSVVISRDREIAPTTAPARAAIMELIEGPTTDELANGYTTSVPSDVTINSLSIDDGIARIDFSEELNQFGGSCAVTAARAQIEETLLQFPTVDEVIISVNGNVEEALQP